MQHNHDVFFFFGGGGSGDRVSVDLEPVLDPRTGSVEQAGLEQRSASLCLLGLKA